MREFFHDVFSAGRGPVSLINKVRFLQPIISSVRRGAMGTREIKPPSFIEAPMFLRGINLVEEASQDKSLNCARLHTTGRFIGSTVQRTSKAWSALAQAAELHWLEKLIVPYILCHAEKTVPRLENTGTRLFHS